MCGICGFVHHKQFDREQLIKMNQTIAYRGPNDEGYHFDTIIPLTKKDTTDCVQIGMAHKRLSILDLSELGHQPMMTEDNGVVIAYNGEIYNYGELRNELIKLGVVFKSNTDTEVVLYAYKTWGIDCIKRFNGMFAIAIYDKCKRLFYLVRDRIGVKPLYYYWDGETLIFGSELKPIMQYPGFRRNLNTNALSQYLFYQYIPDPETIFENVWKIQPGHYLQVEIKEDNSFVGNDYIYWKVEDSLVSQCCFEDYEEAKSKLKDLIIDSIDKRRISDVPLGVFLSGGIDSTLVAAIMKELSEDKVKSFTIGFDVQTYDESISAANSAKYLGLEHYCKVYSLNEAKDDILSLPLYYDEPMADVSSLATTFLSKLTKQYVTVALSGDAGDELFCGYGKYLNYIDSVNKYRKLSTALNRIDKVLPIKQLVGNMSYITTTQLFYYEDYDQATNAYINTYWDRNKKLLSAHQLNSNFTRMLSLEIDALAKYSLTDLITYLPGDILTKVDRASMSVSLEARTPYLDYRIVEMAVKMPTQFKYDGITQKKILKDILYDYVPREMMDRPKKGFGVPVEEWLTEDFDHFTQGLLEDEYISKQGVFDIKHVKKIKKGLKYKPGLFARDLWTLYVFQLWWEKYLR